VLRLRLLLLKPRENLAVRLVIPARGPEEVGVVVEGFDDEGFLGVSEHAVSLSRARLAPSLARRRPIGLSGTDSDFEYGVERWLRTFPEWIMEEGPRQAHSFEEGACGDRGCPLRAEAYDDGAPAFAHP
jgi:hypothetical protein